MSWAISVVISENETIERRLEAIILYVVKKDQIEGFFINDIDATGEMGSEMTMKKNVQDKSHLQDFKKMLMGRKLDIVYEKSDPGNCKMLLNKPDYKKIKVKPSKEALGVMDFIERVCGENN